LEEKHTKTKLNLSILKNKFFDVHGFSIVLALQTCSTIESLPYREPDTRAMQVC